MVGMQSASKVWWWFAVLEIMTPKGRKASGFVRSFIHSNQTTTQIMYTEMTVAAVMMISHQSLGSVLNIHAGEYGCLFVDDCSAAQAKLRCLAGWPMAN